MKRAKRRPWYRGMYGPGGPCYVLMVHQTWANEIRRHLPRGWPKGLPRYVGELATLDAPIIDLRR